MKKIKCMAWFITFVLLLSALTPISVFADERDYSELIAQRQAYFEAKYGSEDKYAVGRTWGEYYWCFPYMEGVGLTVLLYTDMAKSWTFEKWEYNEDPPDLLSPRSSFFCAGTSWGLDCPEIDAANEIAEIERWGIFEYKSHLRDCIQYFGITKEELKEANRKMQEEPDSIRELFPFLSDFEFEDARKDNGLFCYEPLADFMIEALYLEDDEAANNLLCEPYAVYVKDLDRAVTMQMFYDDGLVLSDFLEADLTSDWMGRFLELKFNNKKTVASKIVAAREAQLAAKETGDAIVTSVFVLSLALSTLGAVVLAKKKRKI